MLQHLLIHLNGGHEDEKGFTLIELLVVILIIGILAAIALPTFLGQKDKAKDAAAKSSARNAYTQIEACFTDATTATACQTDTQVLTALGAGGTVSVTSEFQFSVRATSASGNTFTIAKTPPAAIARTCTATSAKGGCPASLSW